MANFEKYALEIAKNRIYNAVVLRLKGNAIMMILLALGYITSHMVRYMFFWKGNSVFFIIGLIFLDTLLAILWLKSNVFHTLHLMLYIFWGGWYYWAYIFVVIHSPLDGMDDSSFVFTFFLAFLMWVFGFIPFIQCGIGRKERGKALKAMEHLDE
ncbi:MAG: hypothetical protein K6C99_01165 [Lachnospiraceae bacterium]|nr:hypothetical protein [Lachnospiraceae bacterium]